MTPEHEIDLMTVLAGGGYSARSCRYSAGKRPHGETAIYFRGTLIGSSYRPIEEAGRHLLENGLASQDDRITFSRDGKRCFSTTVGEAATPRKGKGSGSAQTTEATE